MPRTAIAEKVAQDIQTASWVRQMFERGLRLKQQYGERNVFDFSLGNPNAAPPQAYFDALRACAAEHDPARHRYMTNAGFAEARAAVARFVSREYRAEFTAEDVVLTVGCAGAANVALRAILDPGDEVIVLAPYFAEYRFYIEQAGGRMVMVQTDRAFQPDLAAIEAAITPRTRAVLVNSPNNPCGAVYPDETCRRLGELLARYDADDRPLYLLCDDVYRRVVFDVDWCPPPSRHYRRSIIVSSYSKDLSIPGERAGYIALPPATPQRDALLSAMSMLNRTLGFVNMPAITQRVLMRCADAMCDISLYRRNRDTLCDALRAYGYELATPAGALYAFPRTPIDDDVAFVEMLVGERILSVPGRGFGRPGHIRLSYCVDRETVENSLPGFKAAIDKVRRR